MRSVRGRKIRYVACITHVHAVSSRHILAESWSLDVFCVRAMRGREVFNPVFSRLWVYVPGRFLWRPSISGVSVVSGRQVLDECWQQRRIELHGLRGRKIRVNRGERLALLLHLLRGRHLLIDDRSLFH